MIDLRVAHPCYDCIALLRSWAVLYNWPKQHCYTLVDKDIAADSLSNLRNAYHRIHVGCMLNIEHQAIIIYV